MREGAPSRAAVDRWFKTGVRNLAHHNKIEYNTLGRCEQCHMSRKTKYYANRDGSIHVQFGHDSQYFCDSDGVGNTSPWGMRRIAVIYLGKRPDAFYGQRFMHVT